MSQQIIYRQKNTLPTRNSFAPSVISMDNSNIRNKLLIEYNIEDYLPPQTFQIPNYIDNCTNFNSSTFAHQTLQINTQNQKKISRCLSVHKSHNEELMAKIVELEKDIENIREQKDKLQQFLEESKNQNTKLKQKIQEQNKQHLSKEEQLQSLKEQLQKQIKSNKSLQEELVNIEKQISKKKSNIRIFCQKYQVSLEPKIKHSYTVEVQTVQNEEYSNSVKFSNRKRIHSLPTQQNCQEQVLSNMKAQRPKFYQIYQQKNASAQKYDINNQITTRSQLFPSAQKIKKPKMLTNQSNSHVTAFRSDVAQFQGERRKNNDKILGRIDGKQNKSQLANRLHIGIQNQPKYRIKQEELQICSVDEQNIQHIVEGLLASFK